MKNNVVVFAITGFLVSACMTYGLFAYMAVSSSADTQTTLNTANLTLDSTIQAQSGVTTIDIAAQNGSYLFKTKSSGQTGALEFLNRAPRIPPQNINNGKSVQGVASDSIFPSTIVPENFLANSRQVRSFKDGDDKFLLKRGIKLNSEHYCFEQTVDDNGQKLPVFATGVCVHIKNGNEVYALNGALAQQQTLVLQKIDETQAADIAIAFERQRVKTGEVITVSGTSRAAVNKKVLGIGDDDATYPTAVVSIEKNSYGAVTTNRYFVNLFDGTIMYVDPVVKEALNREIHAGACQQSGTCFTGTSCPVVRAEGGGAVTSTDVNNTYDFLGETYNYYSTTFSRDSYDNHGAKLTAFVTSTACNNAAWLSLACRQIMVCANMAGKDVLAHELTHAVTETTANLTYQNQSGALNEAFSDVFGYAVDNTNWTIGESTALGVIRNMADPTVSGVASAPNFRPQPDKLFSSLYKCVAAGSSCIPGNTSQGGNDSCYVHYNSGVLNHTFYLMTEGTAAKPGGSYNGCSFTGIGKDKSEAVMYRTLTTYLTASANFKSVYTAAIRACTDLYPTDTATCDTVKKAFQATEMDQQPDGQATGAKCVAGSTEKPAGCVGGGTVAPTSSSATATPIPGTSPSATPDPNSTPIPSDTPNPSGAPTTTPAPAQITRNTLELKLRFQGITKKPDGQYNSLHVKVKLVDKRGTEYAGEGDFAANDAGVWSGSVGTAAPEGGIYTLFIKGPKHIQKKVCEAAPTEQYPGSYRCSNGAIAVKDGANSFDLSGVTLLVGDLPEQNGVVNSYDTSLVINNFGSHESDVLKKADVNMDGVVDTQDYSLIIAALSIRYDEQ